MDYRKELFTYRNLYNHKATDQIFVTAVRKNVNFHRKHCEEYAKILKAEKYNPKEIRGISDLYKIPPVPTLYFKHHTLISMPENKILLKSTSSGTSGMKSHIGYDAKGLYYGSYMVKAMARYHNLFSIKPTNYLILGYEPNKNNNTVISKTSFASTFFTPAIKREYALKYRSGEYHLDMEGVIKALVSYSRQPFPVRITGFPAYMYRLLLELRKEGLSFSLHKESMVFLGGGWKQFYTEKVDKKVLYSLIEDILGIGEDRCREFFGAVEHPIVYCDCKNHHFHVPIYSRVIIRDPDTLRPLGFNKVGILNLITPMLESMPVVSVMTDDLAVLHEGKECGCGIDAPYFEIIGRVGVQDIKTCALGASEILGGNL